LPALLPVLLLGSHLVLVSNRVPHLNTSLSCKSAGAAALMGPSNNTHNEAACEQDERDARNKLEQEWTSFSAAEQERCLRTTTLGGNPSYVELLTCLEIAKAASQLPPSDKADDVRTLER
jgi:hypothetical protein